MSKYYAVKKGRVPGVYQTWEECQKQIIGYSGSIFKSFKNKEDADKFIQDSPNSNHKNSPAQNNRNSHLTRQQQEALDIMLSGKNVFITGKAGTGKSYLVNTFINEINKQKNNILVCAPTGIAAINIGGVTIHRCFQISLEPQINPKITSVPRQIQQADIIVVDEISMCRIDLFEYMIKVIEKIHKKIQLIVVGDFFQLPPVTTSNDRKVLKKVYPNYDKGFAFESEKWLDCHFTTINLTNVIRQNDHNFINHLNMIRIGDSHGIAYFNQRTKGKKFTNGINLSAINRVVDEINQTELDKLTTPLVTYEAIVEGEVKPSDKPTSDILKLKVGARVMVLINDTDLVHFQNGSLGTVFSLKENAVVVKLDKTKQNITFSYHEWKIENYVVETKEIDGVKQHLVRKNKIGSFTQIPLKLAYAITIHKSQGQTYDQINLIPYSFDCGQLYVALSRIKSIEGLHLINAMKPADLICDNLVKKFYQIKTENIDESQLFEELGRSLYNLDDNIKAKLPVEVKKLIETTELKLTKKTS